MKRLSTVKTAQAWFGAASRRGRRIALVPTMGALHEGHLELVRRARRLAGPRGIVAVSLFVNPTQFGPKEDFRRYPRNLPRDVRLCEKAGADVVFHPEPADMYAPDFSTWVEETQLSRRLCGRSRPGHFRGVCTIVLKLFQIVRPDIAVFGEKDFQQSRVILRMVRDLNVPVRIETVPTVREASGLARSSRNDYLSPAARANAAAIQEALRWARSEARRAPQSLARLKREVARKLRKRGFRIDYFEGVNAENLEPVKTVRAGDRLIIAVFAGKVRLIDNVGI
ncbi:MAG: pantoate--beta-alanine ligase [Verrucomicrobiae bacterium]|nr:pantoate--beta-alanine ligase [Verrucomicrobiae bacterium]